MQYKEKLGWRQKLGAFFSRSRGPHCSVDSTHKELASIKQELAALQQACKIMELKQDSEKLDRLYLAFENAQRGDSQEIRQRLSVYLPSLAEQHYNTQQYPMLDIGAGRGEWLSLLREQGYRVKGVDLNAAMIKMCKSAGFEMEHADALTYLQNLPANSLSMVSAFHLIEHLPFVSLVKLVEEIYRVLIPGGMIILETPNPENIIVGTHTFYMDPTHLKPIPPSLAHFMLEHFGFFNVNILRLNPELSGNLFKGETELVCQLNHFFYGARDYAAIGFKIA